MNLLKLSNVFVRKYDNPVLNNISWQVNEGEQWAIVGGNGAGKSVLLETLAGRLMPRSGKVERKATVELVAADYSFNRVVRSAAQYYQQRFQSQDAEIAPSVRAVLTNRMKPVGTVNEASVKLAPSAVSDTDLEAVASLLSLTHLLDHPFVTLSNGETRRMLLATSLLKKTGILLFDYPFTGLDVFSRKVLKEAMASMAGAGKTIILVTSPGEIPDFITHVLELGEGEVISALPLAEWKREESRFETRREKPAVDLGLLKQLGEPSGNDFDYAFRLRNIRVVYDGRAVLDDVSWEVKKGERWSLSGPNGSGKSTLLSIITADHPQRFANDFEIFGRPGRGKGFSMWDIKQRIGHVSPELHLYFPADTSVYKAIGSGFFDATGVYFRKINPAQEERIHLVARILKIEDLLEKTFRNISRGEQRLVLLARALVKNPPILVLDEPCQGLDLATTEYFRQTVDAICAMSSHTLIYVSHYPNEIPSCVNRSLSLKDGRVEQII
ncbi:MAG: ABC transporter [Cytophagaceae bacterium SCN 52-12]|nr:MAG: ABC transporter [Cytophagaceae bacterium SCN 52-12]